MKEQLQHIRSRTDAFISQTVGSPYAMLALLWLLSIFSEFPIILMLLISLFLMCAGWATRGRRCGIITLVLSPYIIIVVYSMVTALINYQQGDARLRYGLHAPRAYYQASIDRETRCEHGGAFGRSIPVGWAPHICDVYTFTVRALVSQYGCMRGAYVGPYPTRVQAMEAVLSAVPISNGLLMDDNIELNNELITLYPGLGAHLIHIAHSVHGRLYITKQNQECAPPEIKAILYQDECLLIQVPLLNETEGSRIVVLIEKATGRPFAYYLEPEVYYQHGYISWSKYGWTGT